MKQPSRKLSGFASTAAPATEAVVDDVQEDAADVATCERCTDDVDALEEDASALDARLPEESLCRDHILSILYDEEN